MLKRSWLRDLFARPITRPAHPVRRRARLALEALEGRDVPATFTVTNALDDGSAGSLRWAVAQANATPGADTINFSSLFNAAQTITLTGGQLTLTDTTGATSITRPGRGLTVSGGGQSLVFRVNPGVTA